MEDHSKFDKLVEDLKIYLETRIELGKLQATDKLSKAVSGIITGGLLLVLFSLVLIFISIAVALYVSTVTGKSYYGFGAVAIFYLIIGLLVVVMKKKWIEIPVTNKFIENMYKDEKED